MWVCRLEWLVINVNIIVLIQLAALALLLSAIGGSDMSLHYIFVIHVYLGMHQSEVYKLWIVRVVEARRNILYVAMTQVYSRAVMKQSTCYYFPFTFHIYAFISTTSKVTILCTCPIMHDKLIHLQLFALLKCNTVRIPPCTCASLTGSKVTVT